MELLLTPQTNWKHYLNATSKHISSGRRKIPCHLLPEVTETGDDYVRTWHIPAILEIWPRHGAAINEKVNTREMCRVFKFVCSVEKCHSRCVESSSNKEDDLVGAVNTSPSTKHKTYITHMCVYV